MCHFPSLTGVIVRHKSEEKSGCNINLAQGLPCTIPILIESLFSFDDNAITRVSDSLVRNLEIKNYIYLTEKCFILNNHIIWRHPSLSELTPY